MKKLALSLQTKTIPGIKSIKRLPGVDQELFKSYGKMFLVKYFLDDGRGSKMIAFGSKSASFSNIDVLILFDLKLQPALFFKFKKDFKDEEKFLKFIGNLITKSKFSVPKRMIGEDYKRFQKDLVLIESKEDTFVMITSILSGVTVIISILMIGHYYFTQIKHAAEEYYVNTTIENELNKELFEGQQKRESGFEMFAKLEQYLSFILQKKANALILCGPPGMSKTYTVRRTLHFNKMVPGKQYVIEKGSSLGLSSTYQLLYDNKNRLLVLDDFDTPLKDPDIVNLLKATTDTYGKRIVSLTTEKRVSTGDQTTSKAPRKFEFSGQLIIITNMKRSEIDPALLSRSPAIEVNYNTKQIMTSTEKLLKFMSPKVPYNLKQEAFNFIKLLYRRDNKINVNFRSIKSSIDARIGNPTGWKDMVKIIVNYKGGDIREFKEIRKPYLEELKKGVEILIRA